MAASKIDVFGPVAQLVEHLLCKQRVSGSSPLRSTIVFKVESVAKWFKSAL